MYNIKNMAVLVTRAEDFWDGCRTTVGLALENINTSLFVIDAVISISETQREHLEWLEEMECRFYSNVPENDRYGFQIMTLEKMGAIIKDMDLILPFGQTRPKPPAAI